jgi:hypothetical protein
VAKDGEHVRLHGVDVSSHQPNWVPDPADSFVFIKATEGRSYVSPTLTAQTDSARHAEMIVGFYHFLWPSSGSASPEEQAAWFVQHCPLQGGDLLACDWERTAGGVAPDAEAQRFMTAVQKLAPQHRVGMYVNRSMWAASSQSAFDFLWIADWVASTSVPAWTFWQYSDKPIDQNWCVDERVEDLRDWAEGLIPVEEPVEISDADVERIAAAVAAKLSPTLPKATAAELLKPGNLLKFAKGIFSADVVPAPLPSTTNPNWKAENYLANLYARILELKALIKG